VFSPNALDSVGDRGAVDGNISSGTFGQAVSAMAPRLVQAGVKFIF
jgi:hypothetical protein